MSVAERIAKKKAEKDALIAENARLKELLGLAEPTTEETWGEFAPQDVRDQMAAAALIAERLDYGRALRRLGFKWELDQNNRMPRETRALSFRVFGPGCQAILAEITATEIEPTTQALVKRLKQTALGDDDKASNQAASTLAKLLGLNKEKPITNIDARSQNLFLLGQKGATKEMLEGGPAELSAGEFLNHEPGEAEKIFEVAEGQA